MTVGEGAARVNYHTLSHIEIESEKYIVLINLLVIQKFILILFTGTLKTQRVGHYVDNN